MQTILGAGGTIGVELARLLPQYTDQVRLVSRKPQKVTGREELCTADLTSKEDVLRAVAGSEVAYLTVGLPYSAAVWEAQWPLVMDNVLAACKEHRCKLVFFDNVYMYDPDHMHAMDEHTPVRPTSRKGKVRAAIAARLLDSAAKGDVNALIARSADFYGPGIERNGMVREMIFKKLASGEKANWLCSFDRVHSVTYTPDAAAATALLGNTGDAYGQVWHLPTAADPPTGKEWIEMIARELGVAPRRQLAPKFLVRLMGLFMPLMKELVEMLYQYDRDYVFKSDKFEKRFGMVPTSYAHGIKTIVERDFR